MVLVSFSYMVRKPRPKDVMIPNDNALDHHTVDEQWGKIQIKAVC
jgi:hypothetical protein